MRALLFAGVSCLIAFSAGSAVAQSQSAKAAGASWLGPYAGIAAAYSSTSRTASDLNPSGFSGVGILGANLFQHSNLVFGVEGSAALFGSVKDAAASAGAAWSLSGRVGYVIGDVMPYVSVGLGWAEGKYSGPTNPGSTYFMAAVLGGGVEWRVLPYLSWRVEGLWSPTLAAEELGGTSVKPRATIVRTGLTYKFY